MKAALMSTTIPPEMLGLAHLSRAMTEIVEPGQVVPNRDRIYSLVTGGDLQMIQFIRGRWYCSKDDLAALAQALGLRLREPAMKESSRPRAASRRSAA
jgi:hypothetical protein